MGFCQNFIVIQFGYQRKYTQSLTNFLKKSISTILSFLDPETSSG
jgi:hypothetical protein